MSVWSPSREKIRNFVMREDAARHYYDEWLSMYSIVEITRRHTNGERITSPYSPGLQIWGENISAQEIFKRQLIGTVDREILEQ